MSIELIPGAGTISSGLDAEQTRLRLCSANIANAHATNKDASNTYRRQVVAFESVLKAQYEEGDSRHFGGVRVSQISRDQSPLRQLHDPGHPDADPKTGMVTLPNVNPLTEMVDMMTASRGYESGLAAFRISKQMAEKTISMGSGNA
ncbi:MAG: hypothetical protein RL095_1636 [Verrucomicrobiota bacterium]|jgi:flagellar basal-body rod protein FlgC